MPLKKPIYRPLYFKDVTGNKQTLFNALFTVKSELPALNNFRTNVSISRFLQSKIYASVFVFNLMMKDFIYLDLNMLIF